MIEIAGCLTDVLFTGGVHDMQARMEDVVASVQTLVLCFKLICKEIKQAQV